MTRFNTIIRLLITSFLCLFLFSFVLAQKEKYDKWNGVKFEIRKDTLHTARYTEDNIIYQANNVYYFDFQYFDKNGLPCSFIPGSSSMDKDWQLVSKSDKDTSFTGYKMEVRPTSTEIRVKDYNQSVIAYYLLRGDSVYKKYWERTGLVENKANIWFHPIRTDLFEILEINPFPYIRYPIRIGKQWGWKMKVGALYADKRWAEWEGVLLFKSHYKISNIVKLNTPLGTLSCYVIKSENKSELGKSYLTAYFNKEYGFVKFDYINIDGSKMIIDLIKIERP
jgi:hypothetical protein